MDQERSAAGRVLRHASTDIRWDWNRVSGNLRGDRTMPLTKKGKKIKRAMTSHYGKKKGTEVFYASINKGSIHGVHKKRKK
jgi:hypothetical protein